MVTVFTLTRADRVPGQWFGQCCASVRGQARHVVLLDQLGYVGSRLWCYSQGETMANVDDDDIVMPGALQACEEALVATGAGIAFTWQRYVGPDGSILRERREPVTRRMAASTPDSIHHLSVLRTDLLPRALLDEIAERGLLHVDWIVRAYLALVHGAVQVPMIGYAWRQHSGQITCNAGAAWHGQVDVARKLISRWVDPWRGHEAFPVFAEVA
jgi:hypothetical protein